MRDLINIVDSYTNDTNSDEAKGLSDTTNLEIGDFSKENDELSAYYVIKSQGMQQVVKHYTKESTINSELIKVGGDIDQLPELAKREYNALMSLKGTPLQEEHHVYSGTGTFDPLEVTVNGVFETPAFLSTSLNIEVAVKTTNFRREEDEDFVIHLILPEGFSGCFYVAPYSFNPEELEMLVFPKERFAFIKTQKLMLDGVNRTVHSFKPSPTPY